MTKKVTYPEKIKQELSKLEVGEGFCSKTFIAKNWHGGFDYFTRRSFDVHLAKAKKQFPNRVFKSIKGSVTRLQ